MRTTLECRRSSKESALGIHMKALQSGIKRADYGIDAPTVVRNFFLVGVTGWIVGTVLLKFGPGRLPNWLVSFYGACLGIGACFVLQCLIMIWGSKVGKMRLRDKMIDSVSWRGDEQVLDVGCGHGLMLIGAAKRLTTGRALGIDIWQQEDQASNSAQATLENAQREGVSDHIELRDSDARALPFSDESFDVIVSSFAIHNIYDNVGREKAIREIDRVLKPGGQLALADIRHTSQYAEILRSLGWNQVTRWFPNFLFITPTRVVRAAKPKTRT
ncbi:MAG TPA: class I SAM-dependent methyltransferase [Terriglobales bacterium]|nr:class I SAM-dependent methyltransferase [Terriglobales bacterium]